MDVFGYFILNEIMKIYDNYAINCGTKSSGLIGSFFNKEFCVSLTFLLKHARKTIREFFTWKRRFIAVIMSFSISFCDSDDFDDIKITITEA